MSQLVELINKKRKRLVGAPTVSEIVDVLLEIMKEYVGEENKISFLKLFEELFGEDFDNNNLEHWFKKEQLRKATHACRRYTKCQIISQGTKTESRRNYWVASTGSDAQIYKDILEKQVKAMRNAEIRMDTSIRKKWYRHTEEWQLKHRIKEDY